MEHGIRKGNVALALHGEVQSVVMDDTNSNNLLKQDTTQFPAVS
jgi:hypothetical protein